MRQRRLRAITSAFWLLLFPVLAWADQLQPIETHREAPVLSLPDFGHHTHQLVDYRGRVVLVNFWASWCPPCLVEMPGLQRLAERLEAQPFDVLAVNVGDSENRARRALSVTGFKQTVLLDSRSETYDRWGATVFPTSYLVDKAGRIRFEAVGPLDWEDAEAVESIEALMAEPAPSAATRVSAPCHAGTTSHPEEC